MTTRRMATPRRHSTLDRLGRVLNLLAGLGLLWFAWSALETGLRYSSPPVGVAGIFLLFIAAVLLRYAWRPSQWH